MDVQERLAATIDFDGLDRQGQDLLIPAVTVGKVEQSFLTHQRIGVDDGLLDLRFRQPHWLLLIAATHPSRIRFSAILTYFFCCSMPITLDAPKSSPAASIVPEPAKQSSKTPPGGSRYFTHQAATS